MALVGIVKIWIFLKTQSALQAVVHQLDTVAAVKCRAAMEAIVDLIAVDVAS